MFNERTHETCGEFHERIEIAEISARVMLAHHVMLTHRVMPTHRSTARVHAAQNLVSISA
jgi:hypothetical protein